MPLRLKETLPVIEKLKKENIFAMSEERAEHQDKGQEILRLPAAFKGADSLNAGGP